MAEEQISQEVNPQPQPVIPPVPETIPKPQSNRLKIILFSVLGVLVFAGAVFGAYKLGQKQIFPQRSELVPTPTPTLMAPSFLQPPFERETGNFSCVAIKQNGDPLQKLDLVFVPLGYYDWSFKEKWNLIVEHIDFEARYRGLLYFEPYKSYENKFNFWITDSFPKDLEKELVDMGCQYSPILPGKEERIPECVRRVKNVLRGVCPYDQIGLIFPCTPEGCGGWAEELGMGQVFTNVGRAEPAVFQKLEGHNVTVHEFSHNLGLGDECEFIKTFSKNPNAPNCDMMGCPKWCTGYIKTPKGENYEKCKALERDEETCVGNHQCVWSSTPHPYYKTHCSPTYDNTNMGLNCLEDTGCYYGCGGTDAWRPSVPKQKNTNGGYAEVSNSIMCSTMADEMNPVSIRYLKGVLEKYK